jgi:hypothetical protein
MPTIDDLIQLDRKRKGKKLSNEVWASKTDPDAKIAKMKDGSTHLAYKPEHAVDLDTGVIVAPPIHGADEGDFLDEAHCAGVHGLSEADRAKLKEYHGHVWGPGHYYFGRLGPISFELGAVTQIPINHAIGRHVGALAILDLFFDDMFPDSLGKPLIGRPKHASTKCLTREIAPCNGS